MGVDYFECHKCGFGFRDDSDYCVYCGCSAHFCSKNCAKPIFEKVCCDGDDYEYDECVSCCVCRVEHCTTEGLLNFLLEHFSLTKDKAEELYYEHQKSKQ
jgi:uncharacterized C2H2 Zn-finger protein